jgi:protein-disulfide isomerase
MANTKKVLRGQVEMKFVGIAMLVGSIIIAGSIVWATKSIQNYFTNLGKNIVGSIGGPQRPQAPSAQRAGAENPPPQPQQPLPEADQIDVSQISPAPSYRVKGADNAPVTIVEYSDFQCPFCGRFARDTLTQIDSEYIQKGKVKMVFKHLPLPFHQYAQKAAEAAECAGKIGGKKAFWAMHDKLFYEGLPRNQLDINSLKRFAREIGLDAKKFESCLDSGETAQIVAQDMSESQRLGVRGTPTFFVNGKAIRGALPYDVFKSIIEQELASK